MVVLYPDLLGADDRKRLLAMLAQTPLVSEPKRSGSSPVLALAILAISSVLAAGLLSELIGDEGRRFLWPSNVSFGHALRLGAILALGAGLACGLLAVGLRALSRGRAPYRCGRFLYPFGFVDAEPGRVLILPGSRISDIAVQLGRPSASGASWVTVTVRCEGVCRQIRFRGLDVDVPTDLDRVLRATWGSAEGYRTAREPFPLRERRALREGARWFSPVAVAIATGIITFAVLETWVLPDVGMARVSSSSRPIYALRELDAYHPWPPWLHAQAQRELDARWSRIDSNIDVSLRDGWRIEALELARRRTVGRSLAVSEADVSATGCPGHGRGRWLHRLFAVLGESTAGHVFVPTPPVHSNDISLQLTCDLVPRTIDGRPDATLDTAFTASLQLWGRAPVTTTATFHADTPHYDIAAQIDEHMMRVVFADPE
jgi:hypothetical protein